MKKIFSKKHLTTIIFSVVAVLSVALILPQVFALGGKNESVKPHEEKIGEAIVNTQAQQTVSPQAENEIEYKVEPISQQIETQNPEVQEPVNTAQISEPTVNPDLTEDTNDNVEIVTDTPSKAYDELLEISPNGIAFCGVKFNDRYIVHSGSKYYTSDRYDILEIYTENNKAHRIELFNETATEISLKANSSSDFDIKAKADEIALKLGADLNRYNNYRVASNESLGSYCVFYSRTICGYPTTEQMTVRFDENLNFCEYDCTPNVFDSVDVSNLVIDEQAIIKELNDKIQAEKGYSYTDKTPNLSLKVKDSKIIMNVEYVIKGNSHSESEYDNMSVACSCICVDSYEVVIR